MSGERSRHSLMIAPQLLLFAGLCSTHCGLTQVLNKLTAIVTSMR